jgi:glycosyltransferase involved in cell wall biosynthesis
MRIGVDARELSGRATGVGRYLGCLLAEWSNGAAASRHEFVLYAPGEIPMTLDTRRFATRAVRGGGGTHWEQMRLPAAAGRDHLDVFFAPAYSTPLRLRVPAVVTIHDVSFIAHPEWFGLREGARRRLFCRRAAAHARAIITVSEFSRHELMEHVGVPAGKIHVIPHGIRRPAGSPRQVGAPRVLFVGSIFNRRHVPDLIRAFAPIARAHAGASLDIVGDNRSHPHEDLEELIANERLERQVQWRRYVSDEELQELYAGARAFAFLSEYEGFGFTPLEAIAAGSPAVLLDTPIARESCGDAALYVRSQDLAGTTRALEAVLFDDGTRARLLEAAGPVLARYDWRRAAAETMNVLESCASTSP